MMDSAEESSLLWIIYLLPAFIISLSWMKYRGLEYILFHYRWILAVFVLMPVSLFYDLYMFTRNWFVFKMNSAPNKHKEKVADVQRQVRAWKESGCNRPMCTGRPGWQTICVREPTYKKDMRQIHINLIDILDVDTGKKMVRVEPLVTMGQVTSTLLPLGWTLPVVPELDDLTVGGLIMGVGLETSSHIYGCFHDTCISYELVLADGSLVTCSKDENPDIYAAVPWSHGALGLLVSAEIRIVPAKKFVKLQYNPTTNLDEICRFLKKEVKKTHQNDFVEGLVYSHDSAVIMTGEMTDEAEPQLINRIGDFYKPWFYKHVEGFLKTGPAVEYIPLRQYYHRHTKSLFWALEDIIPFGNNPVFRYLFGWMVPPKVSMLKSTTTDSLVKLYEKYQFFQDMIIPLDALAEALEFFHKEIKLYPIWMGPIKLFDNPGLVHPQGNKLEELYVDVGCYGTPKVTNYHHRQTTRRCEAFVRKLHGFQALYADSYMTREEFREMFDHTLYDKMRKKLGCEKAFPDMYDKTNINARK